MAIISTIVLCFLIALALMIIRVSVTVSKNDNKNARWYLPLTWISFELEVNKKL